MRQRIETKSSELIAIYGRRRVGKTYLVRQFFEDKFCFYFTGIYQGTKKEQLGEFKRQLEYYSKKKWTLAKDWFDAFVHQTFVTTYGLKKNMYNNNVQSEVILDDLFIE